MKKVWLYLSIVFVFVVYSFVLVDPNFTPFSSGLWSIFRNFMVQIGYYQRPLSFAMYATLVVLLFSLQFFLMQQKKVSAITVALGVGFVTLCAYPFLSHDFFNYLFDAKIVAHYHQNPYLHAAWDFPNDPDLRFMHWVQRTYPYGPTFLVMTVVPSFLSFGKFMIRFILFKALWTGLYIVTVAVLVRMSKKTAMFFATSPLIIIEGLVNAHNDLIAVAFALCALYVITRKGKLIPAYVLFLISIGIKYTSMPLVVLMTKWKYALPVAVLGFVATLAYGYTHVGIQPWYFLNLWVLIPFAIPYLFELSVLSVFLLFSYYPYIVLGGWDTQDKVLLKERIIFVGIAVVIILLARKIIPINHKAQPTTKNRSS